MQRTVFEILAPTQFDDQLPIVIQQKTSLTAALSMLFMLIPALAAVFIPFGLIAAHASYEPAIFTAAWANPLIVMQAFAGLVIWAVLFLVPLKSLLSRFGRRRTVRIDADQVHVTEKYLFFTRTWSQPLGAFRGVAHDVRATLSGTRHELILIHDDKRQSLLLHTDDQIGQETIEQVVRLLKRPQLPTRDLYFTFNRQKGGLNSGSQQCSTEPDAIGAVAAGSA